MEKQVHRYIQRAIISLLPTSDKPLRRFSFSIILPRKASALLSLSFWWEIHETSRSIGVRKHKIQVDT